MKKNDTWHFDAENRDLFIFVVSRLTDLLCDKVPCPESKSGLIYL